MAKDDQEYLAGLRAHTAATRELFTNRNKPERERMVVAAFLRCIGMEFSVQEIRAAGDEPVDTIFRNARFQIMEVVGGRRRGDDLAAQARRYDAATSLADVIDPLASFHPDPVDGNV